MLFPDVVTNLEITGCGAVMSGEGLLADPRIFSWCNSGQSIVMLKSTNANVNGTTGKRGRFQVAEHIFEMCDEYLQLVLRVNDFMVINSGAACVVQHLRNMGIVESINQQLDLRHWWQYLGLGAASVADIEKLNALREWICSAKRGSLELADDGSSLLAVTAQEIGVGCSGGLSCAHNAWTCVCCKRMFVGILKGFIRILHERHKSGLCINRAAMKPVKRPRLEK